MQNPFRSRARAANVAVPQSRDEAAAFVRAIGDKSRQIARREADLNDELARMKQEAERDTAPLAADIDALTEGVKVWAEANRDALTRHGAVKFADIGTGVLRWRTRPPKVSLRRIDEVIERIKRLGLTEFLRVREEVNKEALLADPERARLIPGVTVGSEGEDFTVEPFETELANGGPS